VKGKKNLKKKDKDDGKYTQKHIRIQLELKKNTQQNEENKNNNNK
jgi:hypothetical protein